VLDKQLESMPPRKINLLFVHYGDNWIRGSERCLLDLMASLNKEKFSIYLWCNSDILADQARPMCQALLTTDFVNILGYEDSIRNIFPFAAQIKKGKELIKRWDIDVVHANSAAPNQWMLPVTKMTKTPLVTQLHSPYLLRDRVCLGLHHASHLIAVSNFVAEPFISDGLDQQQCQTIYNGIDIHTLTNTRPVSIRDELNIHDDACLVACVGSLIERKGIDIVIRALHQLVEQGIPTHLLVIGDGPEKEKLIALTKHMQLTDCISFVGERSDVQALLNGDVDILVSGAREEAFGLTLAEAGVAKIPVIASNVGGIPEVIQDWESGVLFPKNDHDALASAIATLFKNPTLMKKMGDFAFNSVCSKFSISRNADEFSSIYEELSAASSARTPRIHIRLLVKLMKRIVTKIFTRRFSMLQSSVQNLIPSGANK